MKKSFPELGPPKFKLFNLLSWTHEMVDHKFSFHLRQLASKYFCIPAASASSERCFSSACMTVSELRTQLSSEHLEALNAMPCNKVLL